MPRQLPWEIDNPAPALGQLLAAVTREPGRPRPGRSPAILPHRSLQEGGGSGSPHTLLKRGRGRRAVSGCLSASNCPVLQVSKLSCPPVPGLLDVRLRRSLGLLGSIEVLVS